MPGLLQLHYSLCFFLGLTWWLSSNSCIIVFLLFDGLNCLSCSHDPLVIFLHLSILVTKCSWPLGRYSIVACDGNHEDFCLLELNGCFCFGANYEAMGCREANLHVGCLCSFFSESGLR